MAALGGALPAVLGGARVPATRLSSIPHPSLLLLPRRVFSTSTSHFSGNNLVWDGFFDVLLDGDESLGVCRHEHHTPYTGYVCRSSSLRVRATTSEETSSIQTDELLSDLKEKWDAIENKSTVFLYGGGAIVAVWFSSILVGAINSLPLLPKILELVGLGYTGWFVYRYLLFKSSRKELASDIEDLKKKIAGIDE